MKPPLGLKHRSGLEGKMASARELLPHNLDAERAILGAVLLDNAALESIAELRAKEDFFLPSNQEIFSCITDLRKSGSLVDLVTLAEELTRRGELDAIGGASYLPSLTDGLPKLSSVEHYVKIMREKSTLRRVILAARNIATRAQEGPENVSEFLVWARESLPTPSRNGHGVEVPGVLLSEVKPERVEWLWKNRIPLGKITMLDGDPDLGKSLLTLEISARLSRKQPLPGEGPAVDGGVVILSAEDGLGDTIRPRLEAAGADLDRIVALKYTPEREGEQTVSSIPVDIPVIQAAIERVKAKLVVVDVLMAYLASNTNSFRDQDVRLALAPLSEMAGRAGVAIILIRHLTKAPGGNPLYRGGGSIGIIGGARAGLLVAKDPDNSEVMVLAQMKKNLGPRMPSLTYRIETTSDEIPRIAWMGESQQTAGSLLAATAGDDEERGALVEAKEFLREELGDGPRPAQDVFRDGRRDGFSDKTIKRAKAAFGIESCREGFGPGSKILWNLPIEGHIHMLAPYREQESLPSWDAEAESQEPENSPSEAPEVEPVWEEI